MDIAKTIDHTNLKQDAKREDIERLCREAEAWQFASVCVNPCRVPLAAELLKDTGVAVCTVIGFPLGAASTKTKVFEAREAVDDGATEVDMVLNVGKLKDGDWDSVLRDMEAVAHCVKGKALVKIILETCLLTKGEIVKACELAVQAGADFVKTSTGFAASGAKPEDVALMHEAVKGQARVKASGGIRTFADIMKMIRAGATRIGTSNGVEILDENGQEG